MTEHYPGLGLKSVASGLNVSPLSRANTVAGWTPINQHHDIQPDDEVEQPKVAPKRSRTTKAPASRAKKAVQAATDASTKKRASSGKQNLPGKRKKDSDHPPQAKIGLSNGSSVSSSTLSKLRAFKFHGPSPHALHASPVDPRTSMDLVSQNCGYGATIYGTPHSQTMTYETIHTTEEGCTFPQTVFANGERLSGSVMDPDRFTDVDDFDDFSDFDNIDEDVLFRLEAETRANGSHCPSATVCNAPAGGQFSSYSNAIQLAANDKHSVVENTSAIPHLVGSDRQLPAINDTSSVTDSIEDLEIDWFTMQDLDMLTATNFTDDAVHPTLKTKVEGGGEAPAKARFKSPLVRKPIARPPFPKLVRDRSPILGVSAGMNLRTCFRIGEAINSGVSALQTNRNLIIELYARVDSSRRDEEGVKQHFVFSDLFHDRPPLLNGIFESWKGSTLWEYDSGRFLRATGTAKKKLCRCIGQLERDENQWMFTVLNIWEASWDDVDHVKGIICPA